MAKEGRELSEDLRQLTRQTRVLAEVSRRRLGLPNRAGPLPLLICDDPDQAFQLVRAFSKADLFAPLPILRSVDEAISYLSGAPPFQDRARHPLPTLVLLDLHREGMSGLPVLSWIRQQPQFEHLPVIVLSDSLRPEDIKRAYGVQANSYLIKPDGFEELVEMVKAINLYWASLTAEFDR
jgi:CheY-like chemotaxis protein